MQFGLFGWLAEGVNFLGVIDAHRTPVHTASATDASRYAELVDLCNLLSKAHNECEHIYVGGLFNFEAMKPWKFLG